MGGRMYLGNTNVCPVAVVGIQPTLVTKQITENGTYNASSDNADGYSSVEVNVSGGSSEVPFYEVVNGAAVKKSIALTGNEFSNITSIGDHVFEYAFYNSSGVTGPLSFSSLTTIGTNGLYNAFYRCGITSINLSALTSVDSYGLYGAFSACSGLSGTIYLSSVVSVGSYGFYRAFYSSRAGAINITGVDLSSLKIVNDRGFRETFYSCRGLTNIDLSSLETIGTDGFRSTFYSCVSLTSASFPALKTIRGGGLHNTFAFCSSLENVYFPLVSVVSDEGLMGAFYSCKALKNVYFNSLTTTSFTTLGTYRTQLNLALEETGTNVVHTLHFPSNLQSTIAGLDGYPTFGGTSGYVTLAFDLPATS